MRFISCLHVLVSKIKTRCITFDVFNIWSSQMPVWLLFSALVIFQIDLKKAQGIAPEDKGGEFLFSIFSAFSHAKICHTFSFIYLICILSLFILAFHAWIFQTWYASLWRKTVKDCRVFFFHVCFAGFMTLSFAWLGFSYREPRVVTVHILQSDLKNQESADSSGL